MVPCCDVRTRLPLDRISMMREERTGEVLSYNNICMYVCMYVCICPQADSIVYVVEGLSF